MQRSMLIFAVALVALMAGALFYAAQAPVKVAEETTAAASAAAETPAADTRRVTFAMNDMQGTKRDFSEYADNHTLLNVWATWCAPCRREIPLLKEFHDERDTHGLQVIGLAFDKPEEVAIYAEAAEFNYPVLVGEDEIMAVAESSGVDFVGLPFTMIVHKDGELMSAHMGEIHQEELDRIADVFVRLDGGEIDRAAAQSELAEL
ncbi:MAG: TlpA disulfide reductase family protein [Pseudomonadota bacterium]